MKVLAEFTKTTLVGGVLVILPVYVTILLLAKAVKGLLALLTPVTAQLPAAVQFRQLAAALLLIAVCFVVGLVCERAPACGPRTRSSIRCWSSCPATPSCAAWPGG